MPGPKIYDSFGLERWTVFSVSLSNTLAAAGFSSKGVAPPPMTTAAAYRLMNFSTIRALISAEFGASVE
jgi:hypothetical protein